MAAGTCPTRITGRARPFRSFLPPIMSNPTGCSRPHSSLFAGLAAAAFLYVAQQVNHAQVSSTAAATSVPSRPADPRIERLRTEAISMVDAVAKRVQEIVDMLFSFSELGFEEVETVRYLTGM